MRFTKPERAIKAWFWRLLLGWANIADGIICILTFGFVYFGISLYVATNLARARPNIMVRGWPIKTRNMEK